MSFDTMPWKIRYAFSGFILALVLSSPVEYGRLVDSNSSILEKAAIVSAWIFTLYAFRLVLQRRVWAGRIFAITTGLSMVFLRLNVDWMHMEGFVATSLFAFATVLRFISLLLLASGRRDGWFVEAQSASPQKTGRRAQAGVKPPMLILQAAIGILLGLGMMSLAGQVRWPDAQLVGACLLGAGALLSGILIWRCSER
jgi:hypothetical protein